MCSARVHAHQPVTSQIIRIWYRRSGPTSPAPRRRIRHEPSSEPANLVEHYFKKSSEKSQSWPRKFEAASKVGMRQVSVSGSMLGASVESPLGGA